MPMDNSVDEEPKRVLSFEEFGDSIRKKIEAVKTIVSMLNAHAELEESDQSNVNQIQPSRNGEMRANIILAYRHLEDARMRIGKAMQAYQGGISILDKKK